MAHPKLSSTHLLIFLFLMIPISNGHIYGVDDNPDIRFDLTDLFRQMGYTTESLKSAQAFLHQSIDVFLAVMVLDMRLPQMSGIELQKTMRTMGRHSPIIFISGESRSEEIILAMKGQPIEFLLKPFWIQSVTDAIDKGWAMADTAKKHGANVLQKMQAPQLTDLLALCKGFDLKALDT